MKSHTDIIQSKKLAEFLPLESADMHYHYDFYFDELEFISTITEEDDHFVLFPKDVRCWSLAALLDVIPDMELAKFTKDGKPWYFIGVPHHQESAKTAIEAAYKMVVWLKENKKI